MNTTSTDFRIQESLNALGVKDINLGTSTGTNNFANGPTIDSFSPVDGLKIGSVVCTSRQDYEADLMVIYQSIPIGERVFAKVGVVVFFLSGYFAP